MKKLRLRKQEKALNKLIDIWHTTHTVEEGLRSFLGMTPPQFKKYIFNGELPPVDFIKRLKGLR